MFSPTPQGEVERNGQGYIPTYPTDYLSDFSWDYREKIDLRSQMAAGLRQVKFVQRVSRYPLDI